jgi:hypothetical protein
VQQGLQDIGRGTGNCGFALQPGTIAIAFGRFRQGTSNRKGRIIPMIRILTDVQLFERRQFVVLRGLKTSNLKRSERNAIFGFLLKLIQNGFHSSSTLPLFHANSRHDWRKVNLFQGSLLSSHDDTNSKVNTPSSPSDQFTFGVYLYNLFLLRYRVISGCSLVSGGLQIHSVLAISLSIEQSFIGWQLPLVENTLEPTTLHTPYLLNDWRLDATRRLTVRLCSRCCNKENQFGSVTQTFFSFNSNLRVPNYKTLSDARWRCGVLFHAIAAFFRGGCRTYVRRVIS